MRDVNPLGMLIAVCESRLDPSDRITRFPDVAAAGRVPVVTVDTPSVWLPVTIWPVLMVGLAPVTSNTATAIYAEGLAEIVTVIAAGDAPVLASHK
jgi:hypothetical protein